MEVSNFNLPKIHTWLSILKRLSFVFYEDETSLKANCGFRFLEKCAQGKIFSENNIHFTANCGLFKDAISILHYTASNVEIIDDRFERILEEVSLAR